MGEAGLKLQELLISSSSFPSVEGGRRGRRQAPDPHLTGRRPPLYSDSDHSFFLLVEAGGACSGGG